MTEKQYGPKTKHAQEMNKMKYRETNESFRDAQCRVANALKDDETHYHQFRNILLDQRFLPGGRVQSAMGASKGTTPYNCFVSGIIADSFVAEAGNIMQRATEAAATMRLGGGIGYDFSTLRPRGDWITKLQSHSAGPVSIMQIYDSICKTVSSSGHRRGAQMGVMRVDHPDIFEFVRAKHNTDHLTAFNISVGVTDEFMDCLINDKPFALRFNGKVYREINPKDLWSEIMRSTWDWAEPGVLFIDTINKMNNLWYCEEITTTNPCGEQPLPPNGACLLGSFNLVKYVVHGNGDPYFDFTRFVDDIYPVVRAMDNVVDRATFPLEAQQQEALNKRRMGLGITALANAAEVLGFPYGSPEFLAFERMVLTYLRDHCYRASVMLAREKGPFPLFDQRYCEGKFIQTLPQDIQDDIKEFGIRNSHLTSIAPTGTISLCADNVSSSIEPVFSYESIRTIQTWDGPETVILQDYAVREWGVYGKPTHKVTLKEHLDVLACAAELVDSAVSKTCNVDSTVSWDEFNALYTDAWKAGCKGITTYRADGMRGAVLVAKKDEPAEEVVDEAPSCEIDLVTGRRSCE